jgi:PAS domain S-box-containing protein
MPSDVRLTSPESAVEKAPWVGAIELLWNDGEYVLHRTVPEAGDAPLLVSSPAQGRSRPETLRRLEHAHALRDHLDLAWAARPLSLTQHEGRFVLLIEDPGGEPLARLLGRPMDLIAFLHTAIGLMKALARLHERGLVHKDVKPANILVDTASGKVTLTGFGVASRAPRERQTPDAPEVIAGTLPYMAPEQTGRMNRSIDSRSDLYAAGVTLYEMLTGVLPFTAADPLEWVHCHVARQPTSPSDRVVEIPEQISAIVMKLLAKTPEERYQTAAGVEADLQRCLAEWERLGSIAPFPLGARDIPDRLLIPEKLYGREREVDALLGAFGRVVVDGATRLVLVSGYSGIGKSSVVNELHKVIVLPRGIFISGKFDQRLRDIPYSTLAQAFQGLIRQLLNADDDRIRHWRDAIREAVASQGRLLTDLIPELALIIGPQPPIPELSPLETQLRFQALFQRFVGVFARAEHPLVIFLDDLQWLDPATLTLIEYLVTHPDTRHLLLIGAYRDNEVGPAHPLARTLEAIRQTDASVDEIVLDPLSVADIDQLLADALRCAPTEVQPLSELVARKTDGNPFFACQFLTSLKEEGLLKFDPRSRSWTWDIEGIEAKGFTDNLVDLMIRRLQRLPSASQEALKLLACLGNQADFTTLATVHGGSEDVMHENFRVATVMGAILSREGRYRFLHDRVQEAAYALIPLDSRAAQHLRIGRLLLKSLTEREISERIFDVVNQLNSGSTLVSDSAERERLAALNLQAGQRAKASTAYASASKYLAAGMAALDEDAWQRCYELTLTLCLERAECELLSLNVEVADRLVATLLVRGLSKAERAAAYRLRMILGVMLGNMTLAIRTGLECLEMFGMELPEHPTPEHVQAEYADLRRILDDRPIASLIDLPTMSDAETRAATDILIELAISSYHVNQDLFVMVLCRVVKLGLQHGLSGSIVTGFAGLAFVLGPLLHRFDDGERFAELAVAVADRHGLTAQKAAVHFCAQMAFCWTHPLDDAVAHLDVAYQAARETGEIVYACYAVEHRLTDLLARGDSLDQIWEQSVGALDFLQTRNVRHVVDIVLSIQAFVQSLRQTRDDASGDLAMLDARVLGDGVPVAGCYHWIRHMQRNFLLGDPETALEDAEKAKPILWSARCHIQYVDYCVYQSLALAAVFPTASPKRQMEARATLVANLEALQRWAESCPATFSHNRTLVAAEMARLDGRDIEAMQLYEGAIRRSADRGFIQDQALANEIAARFYFSRGLSKVAYVYLREARDCYARWGALGKVEQLDESHPDLRRPEASTLLTTIEAPAEELDLGTVVKTSEALSGEIVLDKLIHTLMSIAVEHAGASRGLLLLRRDGDVSVEAEATTESDTVKVDVRSVAPTSAVLPQSILRYVVRTQESVILEDALIDAQFGTDPYVIRAKARSILCLPLVKQAKLIGVLYLENHLAPHVFTPARSALLKVLASQSAISLENARLYTDLQRSEAYLVQGQELSRTGTWAFDLATGGAEWSEQISRMLGRDPADRAFTVSGFLSYVHPDDREDVERVVGGMRADGGNTDHILRIVREDGEILFLRSVGTPVSEDGVVKRYFGTVMDVTEHELMTREIRRREAELREIVELSPQALNVLSPDGRTWLYANQRSCELTGHTLEELRAPGWNRRVTHPDDRERVAGEFLEIVRGERRELEVRILCKDRGYRWFLVRYNALRDEQGQVIRWYVTSTDIEDRKRAEESVKRENLALREEIDKASMFEEIVGHSSAIRAVLGRVTKVAPTESTVLITGETGTGKELVARAIHKRSRRSERAFVSVNCSAIPQTLISSELFGHEKGAFTGALQRRLGRFELAEGGTLFLDEVGELPSETQLALLRVLQEREFERVGGTKPIRANVRVVAATNRDLQAAIDAGTFRDDLFYRLNVFPVEIPPLRQRRDDIPALVDYFVDRYASKAGKKITAIDEATMDLLQSYPWPGTSASCRTSSSARSSCVTRRPSRSMRAGSRRRAPRTGRRSEASPTNLPRKRRRRRRSRPPWRRREAACPGRAVRPRSSACPRPRWRPRSGRSGSTSIGSRCPDRRLLS